MFDQVMRWSPICPNTSRALMVWVPLVGVVGSNLMPESEMGARGPVSRRSFVPVPPLTVIPPGTAMGPTVASTMTTSSPPLPSIVIELIDARGTLSVGAAGFGFPTKYWNTFSSHGCLASRSRRKTSFAASVPVRLSVELWLRVALAIGTVHAPRPMVPNSRTSSPVHVKGSIPKSMSVTRAFGRPAPYSVHGSLPTFRKTPPSPPTRRTRVPLEVSTAIFCRFTAPGSLRRLDVSSAQAQLLVGFVPPREEDQTRP